MGTLLIEVEEHDAIPDGCQMRFSSLSEPRPVRRIQYETPAGTPAICIVEGRDEQGSPTAAWAALVDDSSAGQSWLIGGGAQGLRLHAESGGPGWAEPYLLLSPDGVIE